jgi:DegV family protein with EDD domain
MAVKVVTDSASDLPRELAESLGITVVPLNVHFGTDVFKDGVDITADEFYERLITGAELPRTSQPSIGDFIEVYDRIGADADAIISVHISSKLSGTYNAALQAKEQSNAKFPIEVLDTYQASMGVGMIAMTTARAARQGADPEEVAEVARRAVAQSQIFALFDTLEYLQKGGRIGKAQALIGSILRIKPMIIVRDGEVHELGKTRTFAKGVARMKEVARGFAPLDSLSVLHSTSPDIARGIADDLRELLPVGQVPFVTRFGPVIGTYVGPGAVGVGLLRAEGSSGSGD